MKPSINPHGYKIVNLIINGKRVGKQVHTLVARAFCDGYKEGLCVNHKDGNKLNNKAENLEWVSIAENNRHSREVLGNSIKGEKNYNAKRVYGYDKNTGEFKFEFPCVMDAARFFADGNEKRAGHIQQIISNSATNNPRHKTYKGYKWSYQKFESFPLS